MGRAALVPITGSGGWRGGMERDPIPYDGKPHVVIHLDGNDRIMVPADMLTRQGDGTVVLPLTLAELQRNSQAPTGQPGAAGPAEEPAEEVIVPVVEERIDVQKRRWETGGVRVHLAAREREEVVDKPLVREEVTVERVPINKAVAEAPTARQEGNTTIIPVVEEVLVVQKRLMLKEEVRITKRRFEAHEPQKVLLRKEEPQIERVEPEARSEPRNAA